MQYWLFKTEPGCYSWDDLAAAPERTTSWDGVRNYQARNFMKAMKLGDLGFFYHSGTAPAIVGIVKICREAYPDLTAQDPAHWYGLEFEPELPWLIRRLEDRE